VPCFHPLTAYRSAVRGESGRYGITFNGSKGLIESSSFQVPCQKCKGCRVDRSREWAVRCSHEVQMAPRSCFLTLTYDDEHLPADYSIHVRTLQLFLKRLRDSIAPTKIRFFAAGEYGDKDDRPHYHALIFNYDFNDKIIFKKKPTLLYTSQALSKLWTYGFSTIGTANYQSAAYCARYSIKKIGGDLAAHHYQRTHPVTGIQTQVQPEFSTQSRRPGLGYSWFKKYKSDVFPSDFLVVDGKKHPVPKYYLKLLEEEERKRLKLNRGPHPKRIQQFRKRKAENKPDRLKVREEVFSAKIRQLKREL